MSVGMRLGASYASWSGGQKFSQWSLFLLKVAPRNIWNHCKNMKIYITIISHTSVSINSAHTKQLSGKERKVFSTPPTMLPRNSLHYEWNIKILKVWTTKILPGQYRRGHYSSYKRDQCNLAVFFLHVVPVGYIIIKNITMYSLSTNELQSDHTRSFERGSEVQVKGWQSVPSCMHGYNNKWETKGT